MMSPEQFAHAASLWRDSAPMLDHAVRGFRSDELAAGAYVRGTPSARRSSLIAETAFELASMTWISGPNIKRCTSIARERIALISPSVELDTPLLGGEEVQATQMSKNLRAFLVDRYLPQFHHPVPGCGAISAGFADILCGQELIEVKSVQRPFAVGDFRQALTYAALLHSQNVEVETLTLVNARRAVAITKTIDEIAALAAGSRGKILLTELLELMAELPTSG